MTKTATKKTVVPFKKHRDHPEILHGIPVPSRRGSKHDWEWTRDMEVGDSFMLDFKRYAKHAATNFKTWAAVNHPKWEFTCRAMDDGVQIWRTN